MAEPRATAPVIGRYQASGSDVIVVVIAGAIADADVQGLCARLRSALEGSDADLVVCDVGALTDPDVDVGTVDALARLALTARRLGRAIRVRHACGRLRELLVITGLHEIVPLAVDLLVEPEGQPEQREHGLGVQEGVEPDDLTA